MRAVRKRSLKYSENDSDLDELLEPIFESPNRRRKKGENENEDMDDEGPALVVDKILGRKFVKDDDVASGFGEMYLVKWRGLSYIHVSWEMKADIERVDLHGKTKIKRFLQSSLPPQLFGDPSKAEGSGIDSASDEEEDIEYFNPDYAEIHRIISCDIPDSTHSLCQTAAELESMANDPDDTELETLYYVKWRGLPYSECSWERWGDIKYFSHEVFAFWKRQRPPQLESLSVKHPALQDYVRLVKSPVYGISAHEDSEDESVESLATEAGLTMREYQLEGVNWLLWNWWHNRPCILADEM